MSIRIALDNPPEFYTNLDYISGRIILGLHRPEIIGNVVVKLEGESRTALTQPATGDRDEYHRPRAPGAGGFGSGFRTMDGAKQLMLQHVKATLPPSLTGFPQEAEILYYIKVTIQRPGFFRENWRYQVGFKFLPVEPPRPPRTSQEAFARRPFTFRPRALTHQRRSLFGGKSSTASPLEDPNQIPPSIEMSARIPFPSIVTCNEPLPLRLIARKLAPTMTRDQQVYLTALEIVLVGYTLVRVHHLENTERTSWVILSAPQVSPPIALFDNPHDIVDAEFEVPPTLWKDRRLPNTIAPSFRTCNIARRYEIEIKLTLSWGQPLPASNPFSSHKQAQRPNAIADPLYPPQLGTAGAVMFGDAPPSYDEAMADSLAGPAARPAYSGVTAENAPSTMPPEKS
ncbi:hypothetical protein GL218_05791 [Daldinia childiae]|uniref:uncharacterized protein n=1 Tax=Daldinia childiae TaxID=326645 RepID=UPI00144569C0|nr:uncharacterized protein GL218_05791 [Daldinia childiae]KAF3058019.1 hypothetical protein GL218_05791 [Daldinia childiae]